MTEEEIERHIEEIGEMARQAIVRLDLFKKELDAITESLDTGKPLKWFDNSIVCYRHQPLDNLSTESVAEVFDRLCQGDCEGLSLIEIRTIWDAS